MNRKQLIILLLLFIAVGGVLWRVQSRRDQEASSGAAGTGKKLLGESFPYNDVRQITIRQETNQLNLVKKDDADVWRVRERDDYPANFSEITGFLIKVGELKVIQVEDIGASQLARLQLAEAGQGTNSATVLELKDKSGKTMKTLLLGKKHIRQPTPQQAAQFGGEGFPDGRYVMLGNEGKQALLIGDALGNLEPKPELWLNKDFFKVERPKTIAVTFSEPTNSWKITRENEAGDWKFADAKSGETLDNIKAGGVSRPFESVTLEDVVSKNAKPEDNGLDKPTLVTVETFDDFVCTIKVGKKNGENYAVTMSVMANFPKERIPAKDEKPEDKDKADKAWKDRQKQLDDKLTQAKAFEGRTYLVAAWNVDQLLKERKDLVAVKKEEEKKDAPKADDTPLPVPDLTPPK